VDEVENVVVRGRHLQVPQRFRDYVAEKAGRLRHLDPRVMTVDVELSEEHNPRLAGQRERVEITIHRPGQVVRAEAAAADCCAAFDEALDKALEQLRRASDRQHSRGSRVHAHLAAHPHLAGGTAGAV
jgi:ribosomal subunit interface protein